MRLPPLPRGKALGGIAILLALIFSKYVYLASLTSYFTFYLIHRFGVSVEVAQLHLFAFLGAVAVGTIAGGPLGDRFGRKYVIWFSILGALPFTLLLPHASLFWTGPLTVVIGLILASAFPGDRRLRAGTGAGKDRHDLRPVLRLLLRHGRRGRGGAR
jgi:FSR family fosmidomycin resistance protein-like MFS transporter